MASIHGLGYVVVAAKDLAAWESFGTDLLGMQVTERTDDRVVFRLDERAWRFDVRQGDEDTATVIGWEVQTKQDLLELARRLEEGGYAVKEGSDELRRERQVSGLISFEDSNGLGIEIFYGQRKLAEPFVSPTGARFLTSEFGLGHAMQLVADYEEHTRLYTEILGFKVSDYIDMDGRESGTFLHTNPRHHSMAYAAIPGVGPKLGHIMLEVDDMDVIGRALDKVLDGAAPLASTLGRHTNDQMTSFYVKTPSNFEIEYGYGGLLVDDETWVPARWEVAHFWGHRRQRNPHEPNL